MFERYTEKARRVIFFARYEASQYGSPYIETEHILLGLIRENHALANRIAGPYGTVESFRKEIESKITIRERISTSVEVPLSLECTRILTFAAEEASQLGHRHVGTEHLLLGILREEKCLAAQFLQERSIKLDPLREELRRGEPREGFTSGVLRLETRSEVLDRTAALVRFMLRLAQAWNERDAKALAEEFLELGRLVDLRGNIWVGRNDVEKSLSNLISALPPIAQTKTAIESFQMLGTDAAITHAVLNFADGAKPTADRIRVILTMAAARGAWAIATAQCTEIAQTATADSAGL